MSADKDPIRSTHETLALIADKLSIERAGSSDVAATGKPVPSAPAPPPPALPPVMEAPPAHAPVSEQSVVSESPPMPAAEPVPLPAAAPEPPVAPVLAPPPPRVAEPPRTVPAAEIPPQKAKARERLSLRESMLTYFPMIIAVMSIGMSIYQGYLFNQSIDVMQRNVARGEYIRTCREIIETYFQVKQRVGVLMPAADRGNVAGASRVTEVNRLEAQATIAKFGGLGTYLANFQDVGTRARYTDLTKTLVGIMDNARNIQLSDIDKLFAPAEKLFSQMNDDCARLARAMKM